MTTTIGFRPTSEDERILAEVARAGETTSDVLRRALRQLEHDAWLEQARADAARLATENLNDEPETW